MKRLRARLTTVLLGMVASVATLGAEPAWQYAAGIRTDGEHAVEFELWRRAGSAVLRESDGTRLVVERRCDGTTYESLDVVLRHRVVRTGVGAATCLAWAVGYPGAGLPDRHVRPDGAVVEWSYRATGAGRATPPPLDTSSWTSEVYRRLLAEDASARLGLSSLPMRIGRFRFETAFEYTPDRGPSATYVVWSEAPGWDLQVVEDGRRLSIIAPDADVLAAARAALRR